MIEPLLDVAWQNDKKMTVSNISRTKFCQNIPRLPDNVCWLFGLSLDGTGRIYSAKWS
jgi:hypothetical protein